MVFFYLGGISSSDRVWRVGVGLDHEINPFAGRTVNFANHHKDVPPQDVAAIPATYASIAPASVITKQPRPSSSAKQRASPPWRRAI
jgi:hypothetical protein